MRLAAVVDERVTSLAREVGQVGDARLLLMASLLMADDLEQAESRAQEAEGPGVAAADHQRRLGNPAHRGLDDRPAAAQPLGHNGMQGLAHQPSLSDFWPACCLFAAAMDLASMPPSELFDVRSLCAWAK